MPDLVPVDYQPEFADAPVSKSGTSLLPQNLAQQVSGFPQRAADLGMAALGPIGEAGMTIGDMLRTGHVDPRDIPQIAGGVMLGVAAPEAEEAAPLEAGAEAVAKGITAYHGSPYDFDKFDLSKIGTGEGAQAYGHGLYFAENPETAQFYKDALTNRQDQEFTVPGTGAIDRTTLARTIANDTGANTPYGATAVLRDLAAGRSLDEIRAGNPQSFGPAIDWVEKRNVAYSPTPPGKTYQFFTNADPEHFLDWDKPLSEQSPQVQQALKDQFGVAPVDRLQWSVIPASEGLGFRVANQLGDETGGALHRHHAQQIADESNNRSTQGWDPLGEGIYDYVIRKQSPQFGESRSVRDTTQTLRQAGIPGIKYLDRGSRGSGSGTRNYVVFDDNLIDIIKKYGLAGLIAGGASHFATQPVEHDPFKE